MKRDMDLARVILMNAECADGPMFVEEMQFRGYTDQQVFYHIELCKAHGLLDAETVYYSGGKTQPYRARIDRLTWDGHDFLDAIRDERVWSKTKDTIRETVGSVTVATIKEVASMVAVSMVRAGLAGVGM